MKRPSKFTIVEVLIAILIVGFVVRESRLLRGIEDFKYFDSGYWGINISDEVYTLQNMISICGLFIVLIYLIRRHSLKVQTREPQLYAPVYVMLGEAQPRSGKGREKAPTDPFEMVNPKRWRLVSPQDEKKERS